MCLLCIASLRGAAYWRSGPRWSILSVLCPVHPFPLRGTSPQGGTRDMREKTASHILHVPLRCFPLWWLAPPPFPRKRGHNKAPRFHLFISGSTISTGCSSPARGGSPAQRERGASAASQSPECLSCHIVQKANLVTLTL